MLNLILIGIYVAFIVTVGLISMKKSTTVQDFFLGGRKVGAWLSAFSYGTAYFSAVLFIGYAGKIGWGFGLSAVWIGVGNAIFGSLLAWIVLGKKTRNMTRQLGASTMPEFFEKRYNSKSLKIFAALVIFIFLVPYSASVYAGLSYLFNSVFGIEYVYCMLFMAALTAVYLVMGGYIASATIDFVQGIIMIVGIILMIGYVLFNPHVGGISEGITKLSQIPVDGSRLVSIFGGSNWFNLLSLVVLTSFGSWGLPQMVHKFYAIKDDKAISKATIVSTAFSLLIACGAYFVGGFGRLYLNNQIPMINGKPNFDMIMPELLKIALPEAMLSVIILLVLSASMSTLASIVLSSSSAIAMDLVKGALFPNMKKEKVVALMRIMCFVFVALSFIVAYKPTAILVLMSFSWGTVAGSFIGPFLYGLYSKNTTKFGAWTGMLSGFLTCLVFAIISKFDASKAPMIGMLAMLVSVIAVPVGNFVFSVLLKNNLNILINAADDKKTSLDA